MVRDNNGNEVFIKNVCYFLFQPEDMKTITVVFRNYLISSQQPGNVDYNVDWKRINSLPRLYTFTQYGVSLSAYLGVFS